MLVDLYKNTNTESKNYASTLIPLITFLSSLSQIFGRFRNYS